ncbi:MAG: DNA methyltransferase, partial [Candidatus Aminicenantales bacterium]
MVSFLFEAPEVKDSFSLDSDIVLKCGDSFKFIKKIPANCITLIISSPPYNVGKKYEKRISLEEYLCQQEVVMMELVRVLKEDGSLCWQVGNFVKDGEI